MLFSILILFNITCIVQTQYYKAAVVEYAPKREPDFLPSDILFANTQEYVDFIIKAGKNKVDIIVFPEAGLTTLEVMQKIPDHLLSFSVEVPNPSKNTILCENQESKLYHSILTTFSCSAQIANIYVVINILERQTPAGHQNEDKYYSSNIVFDRQGALVYRYRKRNLFKEEYFSVGNDEINTFTTDFGVTFGMVVGYDIMFQDPIIYLIETKNVTDIIHSTVWYSEIPLFQALSFLSGFARGRGVNLLSAGFSDPSNKIGGSGLYLANGDIPGMHTSGTRRSELIVGDVPKLEQRRSLVCDDDTKTEHDTSYQYQERIFGDGYVNGTFQTSLENMENYTFYELKRKESKIYKDVCSENSDFCCEFDISMDVTSFDESDSFYKLAAFYGVRNFAQTTVGIGVCMLVACINGNSTSCGRWKPRSKHELKFKHITVKVPSPSLNIYYQPISLKFLLTPLVQYTYCEKLKGKESKTNKIFSSTYFQQSILMFGVLGRAYQLDNSSVGAIQNKTIINEKIMNRAYTCIAILLSSLIPAMLITSTIIVTRKCRKFRRPTISTSSVQYMRASRNSDQDFET